MAPANNAKVIMAATRDLLVKWENLKESWQDSQSVNFEEYLGELRSGVERTTRALEELDRVIENTRRQVE